MVRPQPPSRPPAKTTPAAAPEVATGDEDPGTSGAGGVRSVQRSLEILSLLTEQRPHITIREIVAATGLAKTTVLRLAQTLEHAGLLWATDAGYMAGPGLWRWAHLARNAWELPPETRQMMADMARSHEETVNLYLRRDINRLCIAQAESPRALRHVVNVGDELPLWAGASAKVLLIGASDALLARVTAAAPAGAVDPAVFLDDVARAREEGCSVSHGERESGVSAVAVPLVNQGGHVVAALSLSGSSPRFTEQRIPEFVESLRSAAAAMSGRGLGGAFQSSPFQRSADAGQA